jgi:hypothetical protein
MPRTAAQHLTREPVRCSDRPPPALSPPGEPAKFTGVDARCEKPSDADLRLETVDSDPADNAAAVLTRWARVRLREWRHA